MRKYRLNHYNY